MGFLDKAKQMAEQAQTKLDEVQKQFNESQAASSGSQAPAGRVRQARPPDPLRGTARALGAAARTAIRSPAHEPAPPPPPRRRRRPTPPRRRPRRRRGTARPPEGVEDRNHPSYAPPKLTSGDPLR